MINIKNNKVIYLIIFLMIIVISLLIYDDDKQSTDNFIPTAIPTITPEPKINPTSNFEEKPTVIPTVIATPTIVKIQPTPIPPRSYVEEMGRLIYEKGISAETLFLKEVTFFLYSSADINFFFAIRSVSSFFNAALSLSNFFVLSESCFFR